MHVVQLSSLVKEFYANVVMIALWWKNSREKWKVAQQSAADRLMALYSHMSRTLVCTLRVQTGVQYSAGAKIKANAEILKTLKDAPHLVPVSCLISATLADFL